MTNAERREKLTRLRDQVDDINDSVHALYAASEAGSALELALAEAHRDSANLRASLGRARDALNKAKS